LFAFFLYAIATLQLTHYKPQRDANGAIRQPVTVYEIGSVYLFWSFPRAAQPKLVGGRGASLFFLNLYLMNNKQRELIEKRLSSEMSSGERTVYKFLESKSINFEREFFFEEFVNKSTGYHLFFDFYLIDLNIAIEVDGAHHFKAIKGQSALIYQKQRDNIKNKYCKRNGIALIRVRYSDGKIRIGKLERLLLEAINKKPNYSPKKIKHHPVKRIVPKRLQKKNMTSLINKNEQRQQELEQKRMAARSKYPKDILEKIQKNEKRI
jgi:very-short-patch-repair endonuclease